MRFLILLLLLVPGISILPQNIDSDKWTYIEIDSARQKWGDFDEPEWLRYFGLSFTDVNNDELNDIISGSYVYINPGGDMSGPWKRIDLGQNVDAMLSMDVDGDEFTDVIAQALPNVYWFEADDIAGNSWKGKVIAQLPKTGHNNGQGYDIADIFKGDKSEILMTANGGIFALAIPEVITQDYWDVLHVAHSKSDEGFACADIDADGHIDLIAGDSESDGEHADILFWYENPGNISENWKRHKIGNTVNAIDRVRAADLNNDGLVDIGVAEEQYPPEGPTAFLFWFEQKTDGWKRHQVVQQWSMHNLDIADMDGDGDQDLMTAEHQGNILKTQIWENDGKGNFSERLIDQGKESHLGTRVCDLDHDGDLDIASIAWNNYKYVHVWRNDGSNIDQGKVRINSVLYRESEHYRITTGNAVFYLEKSSGGITSMIDKNGRDWIDYNNTYGGRFPHSAAADFRGIPNMIYGQNLDNGTGHPGFSTIRREEQTDENTIRFESENGFVFSWSFFNEYAQLEIEETIPNQTYWILYEGPIGGKFSPQTTYWGTNTGMRTEVPDYLGGETIEENWNWIYFGDKNQERVLFIKQEISDDLPDIIGYMGNSNENLYANDGMVVFGFGRNLKTESLLDAPNTFYFGFYEEKIITEEEYNKFTDYLNYLK